MMRGYGGTGLGASWLLTGAQPLQPAVVKRSGLELPADPGPNR